MPLGKRRQSGNLIASFFQKALGNDIVQCSDCHGGNKEKAFELYNKLQDNGVNTIIDDRENLNMGNRINDVYALGTPYMLVMGKKFEDGKYELETSKTGDKEIYTIEELIKNLKK